MHSNYLIQNCYFKLFIMPIFNNNFKVDLFKKMQSVQKSQKQKLTEIQQVMFKHWIRSCIVHKNTSQNFPLLRNVTLSEKDSISKLKKRL